MTHTNCHPCPIYPFQHVHFSPTRQFIYSVVLLQEVDGDTSNGSHYRGTDGGRGELNMLKRIDRAVMAICMCHITLLTLNTSAGILLR
jgi:hypothetical protein